MVITPNTFMLCYEPVWSHILIKEMGYCPNSVEIFTDIDCALKAHKQIVDDGRLAHIRLTMEIDGALAPGEIIVEEPLDEFDRMVLDLKLNPQKCSV